MTAIDTAATMIGGLHVERLGSGPPLLVVHGGPGFHHAPYHTLNPLGEGRELVFWDHRGHGRSAPLPDGPIDIGLFADDAVAIADALGLTTFAVFGHSFGGWVAQELAVRHAGRVSALVLAATTPGQLGTTESPDDDQGPPPPAVVARLMSQRPTTNSELAELYRALTPHFLRTADPAAMLAAIDASPVSEDSHSRVFDALDRWSSVDRLSAIRCPTLVAAGRHDVFCSVPQLERIARRIAGAELAVFENSGHFMWLEEPDAFFACVGRWLDEH